MRINSLPRVLLRRWYVVLLGLLITAVLGFAASVAVPAKYEAKSSILLLPPVNADLSNPYLALGGLSGVTDVVAQNVSDSATADSLKARGLTGSYTVTSDQTTSAPILVVTADAASPGASLAMMRAVDALIGPALTKLQRSISVPTKSLIDSRQIYADAKASAIRKSQTRAVLAAVAVGLLLTVLLAALAERILGRRRSNAAAPTRDRAPRAVEPAGPPATEPAAALQTDAPKVAVPPRRSAGRTRRGSRSRERAPVPQPAGTRHTDANGHARPADGREHATGGRSGASLNDFEAQGPALDREPVGRARDSAGTHG